MYKFKVYVTETITRPVWVLADTPAEAERVVEESYDESETTNVEFEADPMSRQIAEQ